MLLKPKAHIDAVFVNILIYSKLLEDLNLFQIGSHNCSSSFTG